MEHKALHQNEIKCRTNIQLEDNCLIFDPVSLIDVYRSFGGMFGLSIQGNRSEYFHLTKLFTMATLLYTRTFPVKAITTANI
jgi:hypothetical protein